MNDKTVPRYLIGTSDYSVTRDDLVAECYCHLLAKLPGYRADKSPIMDWVHHKSIHFFQSYFRQLTSRRELRVAHAASCTKSRKGIVRYGKTFDQPPADVHNHAADQSTSDVAYRRLGREVDPRPGNEWLIDLADCLEAMPEPLRQVMQLVIDGLSSDQIAWQLDLHPTTVTARQREAKAWLAERMG